MHIHIREPITVLHQTTLNRRKMHTSITADDESTVQIHNSAAAFGASIRHPFAVPLLFSADGHRDTSDDYVRGVAVHP